MTARQPTLFTGGGTWNWRFRLLFRKSPRWAKLDGRRVR